jgi:hypothetical protein
MITRRRLALQLTPLLDLLLIVMFAQYVENRDRATQMEEELAVQRAELEQELSERRESLEQEFAKDRREVNDLRNVYDERFRSMIEQHYQIGTLLAQTLNLPGAAMAEVLKLRTSGATDDADRLTSAMERLRELMEARGDEVFRFLLRVDEMQKHVSVWEVHVLENGQVSISDGERSFLTDFSTSAEFSGRLYESSKSFADSRTLVILLLTWGDAQGGSRQKASEGMPMLTEQLRKDAAGTRWFDFSILGFRPEGPIFSKLGLPGQR